MCVCVCGSHVPFGPVVCPGGATTQGGATTRDRRGGVILNVLVSSTVYSVAVVGLHAYVVSNVLSMIWPLFLALIQLDALPL